MCIKTKYLKLVSNNDLLDLKLGNIAGSLQLEAGFLTNTHTLSLSLSLSSPTLCHTSR